MVQRPGFQHVMEIRAWPNRKNDNFEKKIVFSWNIFDKNNVTKLVVDNAVYVGKFWEEVITQLNSHKLDFSIHFAIFYLPMTVRETNSFSFTEHVFSWVKCNR